MDPTELKAAEEARQRAWTEFKSTNDARLDDIERKKADDGLTKEKLARISTELDKIAEKLGGFAKASDLEIMGAMKERLDQIEVEMRRPGFGDAEVDREQLLFGDADDPRVQRAKSLFESHKIMLAKRGKLERGTVLDPRDINYEGIKSYERAFPVSLRLDDQAMNSHPESKALTVGADPEGGYLVPPAVSNRVITKVNETSNMRGVAFVEQIGSNMLHVPRDEGDFSFGWAGELAPRPPTGTSGFGMSEIPVWEWYALPIASQQMLEDAVWDIERWIGMKVGDIVSRGQESAFFTGNGVNKPRGLLTYPAGTGPGQIEQIPSGAAAGVTADGLITLAYSLPAFYARNARWMVSRRNRLAIRLLKDGQENYLWDEGSFRGGEPPSILGYPVTDAEDMPAIAAGTLPIAFGDFRAAYTIVDRLGLRLLRDPYVYKPNVGFYFRGRVGGGVVDFRAVKLLKISVS